MWRVGCVPGALPEPRRSLAITSLPGASPSPVPRRSLAGASPEPRPEPRLQEEPGASPEPRRSPAFENTCFWYILASGVSIIF